MKKTVLSIAVLILALTLVLCACSQEITEVVVTFDGNGGSSPEGVTVALADAEKVTLPVSTREDYRFCGWTFDAAGQSAYSAAALREKKVGEITLYAKWEPVMRNGEITVRGVADGKATVNPTFEWSNLHNDTAFSVYLTDEEDAVVETATVSAPRYEVARYLESGKTYTLTVTGEESEFVYETTFETRNGSDSAYLSAILSFADPFGSHMVLQRGKPVVISGTTNPNVAVTLTFKSEYYYATSDADGAFYVTLPAQEASTTPVEIEARVLRNKKSTLTDVLFGDVFLASGQSNMWWKLRDSDYDQTTDVDNAVSADMRFYSMRITKSTTPMEKVRNGKWSAISRDDASYKDYSAIAFMTGSMVAAGLRESGVPIGIMQSAEGDTNIANWIGSDYYDGSVNTKHINYNAMIYPLRRAEIKGVIWYQGCNNSAKGCEYEELLKSLIANWRALFRNDTLPFYVVQLPVYDDALATAAGNSAGNPYEFSFVRESQLLVTESDANAYLIATCDGGDPEYIHPTQKRYIAERLTP